MNLVGIILAGGTSARMGVTDKALAMLGGRRLIDHVHARLAPQVDQVVINAGQDYGLNLPCAPDHSGGVAGPVAGVHAGLRWAQDQERRFAGILTVPVDAPFLPPDLVDRLTGDNEPAYAMVGDDLHPTFGYWPLTLLDLFGDVLTADRPLALRDWAKMVNARPVKFSDRRAFTNINSDADLSAAQELLDAE